MPPILPNKGARSGVFAGDSLPALLLSTLVLALSVGCAPPSDFGREVQQWRTASPTDQTPESPAPTSVPLLDWTQVDASSAPMSNNSKLLWVQGDLPTATDSDVLFIPRALVALHVYFDGSLAYTYDHYPSASGVPWHMISLPSPPPQTVTFRLRSHYTKAGLPYRAFVGDRAAILSEMFAGDLGTLIAATILAVFFLGSVIFLPFAQDKRAVTGLALFSFCLSVWTAFYVRTKQIYFPAMDLWFYAWWITVPWITVGLGLFVEGFFGPGPRNLWLWLRRTSVVIAVTGVLLLLFPATNPSWGVPFLILHRTFTMVAFPIVTICVSWLRPNRHSLLFAGGFFAAMVCSGHDVASSFGVIEGGGVWSHWGFVILDATLFMIIGLRYRELRERVSAYATAVEDAAAEREGIVQELHDGLGGIATNIKLLAERARDDASPDTQARTISTIADLAGDAVSEIRDFMRSFDDEELDWRALAADLRYRGRTTVDPHGLAFEFESTVDPSAPSPSPRNAYGLVRIYSEALTNCLKHAEAQRIQVQLHVGSGDAMLRVSDDGRGIQEDSPGGRGLKSILARASQMGGTAQIQKSESATRSGTTVEVTIPT